MSLLVLMFPATAVTVLVVVVLVITSLFQKEGDRKFTSGLVIISGLHFLALLAVALSVLQLYFSGIEKWIPDLLADNSWRMREQIDLARYAISALIVAAPLYLVLLWKGAQAAVKDVSWIKRFLSSAVLIVAFFVAVCSLVAFVYNFLSGELGLRMFAKIVSLLVISGGIAAYYQLFVRGLSQKVMRATKIFAVIVALVVIDSISVGFLVTGGPAGARAERFDDIRFSDLSNMQWQIQSYLEENESMPTELLVLHDASRGYSLPADPKTKSPYEYRMISMSVETLPGGESRNVGVFELCASFETERKEDDDSVGYQYEQKSVFAGDSLLPGYYDGDTSPHWNHGVGRHCFERTVKSNAGKYFQVPIPTAIPRL